MRTEQENRTVVLVFRVTPTEREQIAEEAQRNHCTVSELLRRFVENGLRETS